MNIIHETSLCNIKVDIEIVEIVQCILDNYPHSIIPISSCQNQDGRAFIMLDVRDINDLDILLETVFYDRITNGTLDFRCEYHVYKNNRSYIIRWNSKCNNLVKQRTVGMAKGEENELQVYYKR